MVYIRVHLTVGLVGLCYETSKRDNICVTIHDVCNKLTTHVDQISKLAYTNSLNIY